MTPTKERLHIQRSSPGSSLDDLAKGPSNKQVFRGED